MANTTDPDESFWGKPTCITISASAATSRDVGTNYLLNIAHRMLADNAPDLQQVRIIRDGLAFKNNTIEVVLERQPNGKVTETWGNPMLGVCQGNTTETP